MFNLKPLWIWPPVPGLLSEYRYPRQKDRAEWGVDEWRDYALFLEEYGGYQNTELQKMKLIELFPPTKIKYGKRGRPRKIKNPIGLLFFPEAKGKPGRKMDIRLQEFRNTLCNVVDKVLARKGHRKKGDIKEILGLMLAIPHISTELIENIPTSIRSRAKRLAYLQRQYSYGKRKQK